MVSRLLVAPLSTFRWLFWRVDRRIAVHFFSTRMDVRSILPALRLRVRSTAQVKINSPNVVVCWYIMFVPHGKNK